MNYSQIQIPASDRTWHDVLAIYAVVIFVWLVGSGLASFFDDSKQRAQNESERVECILDQSHSDTCEMLKEQYQDES